MVRLRRKTGDHCSLGRCEFSNRGPSTPKVLARPFAMKPFPFLGQIINRVRDVKHLRIYTDLFEGNCLIRILATGMCGTGTRQFWQVEDFVRETELHP